MSRPVLPSDSRRSGSRLAIRWRIITGRVVILLSLSVALVMGMVAVGPSSAEAAPGNGTVRVRITAPEGVAATVTLADLVRPASRVAVKPPAGRSVVVDVAVPAGAHRVLAPRVISEGVGHDGRTVLPVVGVAPGRVTDVTITYVPDGGARGLRVSALSATGTTLTWTGPPASQYLVRRAEGPVPPAFAWQGVPVPVQGTRAVDRGLRPGVRYSYSLFTLNRTGWHGPLTTVAGTTPPAGSTDAAYIAAPTTLLAAPGDVAAAASTGTGVRARLADRVPAPLVGSAVVLPISAALPGGYLGVVSSIAADGHTLDLGPGGLGDAFDYYEIATDEFTAGDPPAGGPTTLSVPSPGDRRADGGATQQEAPSGRRGAPGDRGDRPRPSTEAPRNNLTAGTARIAPAAHLTTTAAAAPSGAAGRACTAGANGSVSFDPQLSLGGHFSTKVDKYGLFGIPSGASVDASVTATVSAAARVEASAAFSCSAPLSPVFRTLTTSPVPISVLFTPTATFSASGAVSASSVGVTATAGVRVSGRVGLTSAPSFTGSPILTAGPLAPTVTGSAGATAKVGGELILGPGAGTTQAGVIAGLGGTLFPVDASFALGTCSELAASFTRGLALQAKAFLGGKKVFDKKIDIPALGGSTPYPGFPKRFPTGCTPGSGSGAPDSLLGDGVTKVGESTTGGADQWGHVNGFAPGKKTWVLSTGTIDDALGSPGDFASTDLGRTGDDVLSGLAGHPTYDAAAYQVTVVPTGRTLHVRYAFASEEYPEFVGSSYNDVMAVTVGGTSCGVVPGTDQPVSVNTVNPQTNSGFYVDNSVGASGYSTSMDGLTVPLNCDVAVTPGVPVTVRLSVADSSDQVYDSAIALLDGGIWTD